MAITIDGDNGISGVNGSATTPALQGTDSNTGIVFGTDEVSIATGGSTKATVDSSGNLGIGTTSPTFTTGGGVHNKGENAFTSFRASVNANTGIDFAAATDGKGYLYNRDNADLIFGTNNTERLRILSSGGLTFNGDTAAANALNDYEEGTWTPTTYSDNLTFDSATYVKIGRMVTAHCSLTGVTSYNAATSNPFWIFGFPFTTASGGSNNTPTSATGACRLTSMSESITTGTLSACMDKNNTRCRIQKNATNAADSFIRLSDVGTGSFGIVVNVTYYTT